MSGAATWPVLDSQIHLSTSTSRSATHSVSSVRGMINLDGADGFRYDVSCDGQLNDGGTVDRQFDDAYDGMYQANLERRGFCSPVPVPQCGFR